MDRSNCVSLVRAEYEKQASREDEMAIGQSRREMLKLGAAAVAAVVGSHFFNVWPAQAASTVTLADIGVGDPGDWSKFTEPRGHSINLVSIGNAPSAVLNQLLAGGGQTSFNIINIVGGMQKPLVDNDLILELDTARLSNWEKNSYIQS